MRVPRHVTLTIAVDCCLDTLCGIANGTIRERGGGVRTGNGRQIGPRRNQLEQQLVNTGTWESHCMDLSAGI